MPPYPPPINRDQMGRRVRTLTAGAAVAATAAALVLTAVVGAQVDTGAGNAGDAVDGPTPPTISSLAPEAGNGDEGNRDATDDGITVPSFAAPAPETAAPDTVAPPLQPVLPPGQAGGRSHAGSGGS